MSDSNSKNQIDLKSGEADLLLDHNYDGIHELDHVLPRWWLWLFYGCILFAAWYAGYYMSGYGPTPRQELKQALQEIEVLKPASTPIKTSGEEDLLAAYKDPNKVKHGAEVFASKCVACHGDKAQGIVGPNLTDDFWIHGKGTLKDIAEVVQNGVADKGMPPWGSLLNSEEIRDVVAFVRSVHGSNPPGAKAPQGDKQEFRD